MATSRSTRTPFGDRVKTSDAVEGEAARVPRCGRSHTRTPELVGIVFVHGVGFQEPGDTLLAWTKAVERTLRGWAVSRGLPPEIVRSARYALERADHPLVLLCIPAVGDRLPQHWLITEALWAPYLREPTDEEVATWLSEGGAAGRMADAMLGTFGRSEPAAPDTAQGPNIGQVYVSERQTIHPIEGSPLNKVVAGLTRLRVGVAGSAIAGTLLLGYLGIRTIAGIVPGARGVVGGAGRYLRGWVGDMQTLLTDPTQAANVRERLAGSVDELRSLGVKNVILVAHSGGAVASYMFLAENSPSSKSVSKLITFGEGLNTAWDLIEAETALGKRRAMQAGLRLLLLSPIRGARRWVDFFSSEDPVPHGPLKFPFNMSAPVESHGWIWNRVSVGADHGTYWDNDEEFVIPVVQHLDTPNADAAKSRFSWPDESELVRARRRRVSLLGLWRRAVFGTFVLSLAIGLPLPLKGGFDNLGMAATNVWNVLPLHELLSVPVETMQSWRATTLDSSVLGASLLVVGAWTVVAFAFLMGAAGLLPFGRWSDWDSQPRWERYGLRFLDWLPSALIAFFAVWNIQWKLPWVLIAFVAAGLLTYLIQQIWLAAVERGSAGWQTVLATTGQALMFVALACVILSVLSIPELGRPLLGVAAAYGIYLAIRGIGSWVWLSLDRSERDRAIQGGAAGSEGFFLAWTAILFITVLWCATVAIGWAEESFFGDVLPPVAAAIGLAAIVLMVLSASARASSRSAG